MKLDRRKVAAVAVAAAVAGAATVVVEEAMEAAVAAATVAGADADTSPQIPETHSTCFSETSAARRARDLMDHVSVWLD